MANALRMSFADYRNHAKKKDGRIKGTKRKTVNGIEFDSTREARAYQDLMLMQVAGQISGLRRQVPFQIIINGHHICEYRADFVFMRDGRQVVADAKGFRTEIYRLKRKMMLAQYGIEIEEM